MPHGKTIEGKSVGPSESHRPPDLRQHVFDGAQSFDGARRDYGSLITRIRRNPDDVHALAHLQRFIAF